MTEDGPEKWVPEAIAQQEEYLKRQRSCLGQLGRSHKFIAKKAHALCDGWRSCAYCSVTETDEDYQRKIKAAAPPSASPDTP